jgi:hypothetical protein
VILPQIPLGLAVAGENAHVLGGGDAAQSLGGTPEQRGINDL